MATISDVARESGVSKTTVSFVLNDGPRPVNAQTRERVLEVMRRLNYHPNATARALTRGRTNILGVLFARTLPGIVNNQYASAVLEGILTAAMERGYNALLLTEPWQNAAVSAKALQDGRTDGVLVIAPFSDSDMVSGLAALNLPLVVISAPATQQDVPFVDVDNAGGVHLAVQHLLSLGHTRIAHLAGDTNHYSAASRQSCFRAFLAAAGIPVPEEYVARGMFSSNATESNRAAARHLLSLPQPPTAIFAANDALAVAALEAARGLDLSVPEQLSIVGFDDLPMASLVTPGLTTVRQPVIEIAKWATRLLVARVENKPVAFQANIVEPTLVVRGSTGPPS